MRAMILSAGLGTRLKPFTDQHPKALAPVNGKSLLQRNVEYLLSYNIREIIINVHHFAGQIRDEIRNHNGWGAEITISDESEEVLETGGGLKKAEWFFNGSDVPFILLNVDILTDLNLDHFAAFHRKADALATLAVGNRQTSRYFLFDEEKQLCGWKNTLSGDEKICRNHRGALSSIAFSGVHIINPELLSLITQKGKFSMVDVYLSLCGSHSIKAYDPGPFKFIDVGRPESILKAEELFL